jgi:hypothetical protein
LRAHRFFAGADGPGRPTLPLGELLHPAALAAVLVLVANDWLLKPSAAPGWLTGKLSDLAGLAFFPLLLTAALDLALMAAARLGAPVDFSLRRWKLHTAVAATAVAFTAIKLWAPVAAAAAGVLRTLGLDARIVADPTDLLTLPALAVALWIGRRELRRVPLGRLEVIERAWKRGDRDVAARLADVPGSAALAAGMVTYLDTGDPAPAEHTLCALRRRQGASP